MAALAGEQPRFSDDLVERFALVDPPRIFRGHYAPLHVLYVCARARPELARKCVSRLQVLIDQGYFSNGVLAPSKPWLASYRALLEGDFKRAAAIRCYNNHGDALFRFVDDPIVPIDNSPTERELQNVAKLRLNMLFAGSTEGHDASADNRRVRRVLRYDWLSGLTEDRRGFAPRHW
ncbi:hypothetical protein BH11MYX4_BH11MYX4_07110 [soil metagenome]